MVPPRIRAGHGYFLAGNPDQSPGTAPLASRPRFVAAPGRSVYAVNPPLVGPVPPPVRRHRRPDTRSAGDAGPRAAGVSTRLAPGRFPPLAARRGRQPAAQ